MVAHIADCVGAAEAGAHVLTLLADACLVAGTVVVEHALGSTVRWCALEVGFARTGCAAFLLAALCVRTAWVRLAWVAYGRLIHWSLVAGAVGIPGESGRAIAARLVVDYLALCLIAAGAFAWVTALERDTGLARDALRVGGALMTTAVERVPDVAREAGAQRDTVHQAAVGVRAARRRQTRVSRLQGPHRCGKKTFS